MKGEIKSAFANFVVVEKVYGFLVYSYSYHKLGDLSTTLEMTVLFFSRHFDQVKRVEKSPKAEQGYAMKSVLDG